MNIDYEYNAETDSLTVIVTRFEDGGRTPVETTETRALWQTDHYVLADAIEYFDPLMFNEMEPTDDWVELAIALRSCFMRLEEACDMQDVASATKRKAEGVEAAL